MKADIGDTIELKQQEVEVVECEKCGHEMANIDADELYPGDLLTLKRKGVYVSNPETKEDLCIECEFTKPTFGQRLARWFASDDDDDDSSFFTTLSSGRSFGGSSSSGGFKGFGGGTFSGGGASRGF